MIFNASIVGLITVTAEHHQGTSAGTGPRFRSA
jgi:hypothetical protein